jgi:hypothetical protein
VSEWVEAVQVTEWPHLLHGWWNKETDAWINDEDMPEELKP